MNLSYYYRYYLRNIFYIFYSRDFRGWGRKKTGLFAQWCYKKFGGSLTIVEDGFIRSIGLCHHKHPRCSLIEDDIGIYYDATMPSKLENILNEYDFQNDKNLLENAKEAMSLILKYNITKYNHAPCVPEDLFNSDSEKILIISQVYGDCSLTYGLTEKISTDSMIDAALNENPNSEVYLKVHPDVIDGIRSSDIDLNNLPNKIRIISNDFNSISLLKYFSKIYTKTSGMGFEALIAGCKCVCFGMPFYAGWGVTDDRVTCERRSRKLDLVEIFAASYILYTKYYNPYKKSKSDIIDIIHEINFQNKK